MASRFLLDENLSPRLSSALCDVQLKGKSDQQIWDFASENGNTIVSKGDLLVVGNTSTAEAFINEPLTSLLTLRKP